MVILMIDMVRIGSTENSTVRQKVIFEAIIIFLFVYDLVLSLYNLRFLIASFFRYIGRIPNLGYLSQLPIYIKHNKH